MIDASLGSALHLAVSNCHCKQAQHSVTAELEALLHQLPLALVFACYRDNIRFGVRVCDCTILVKRMADNKA